MHDSGGMATLFGDSYAVNGACLTLWPGLRLWQAGNRPGLGGTVWRADVWAHSGVLLSLPGRTAWPMLVRRALTGGTGYGGPAPPALEGRFGGQADGSMAALSCRCPVELPGRCWSGGALAGGTGYGGPAPPALAGGFGGQTCGRMAVLSCHCPVELPGRCWSGGALVGEKCGIPHGKWEGDGASVREIRALTGRFGGQADGRMAVFSCHCPVELSGRCWSDGALAGVMVGRHLRALAKLFRGRTGKGTDGLCRSAPFGAAWLEWVSRRRPGREGASRL